MWTNVINVVSKLPVGVGHLLGDFGHDILMFGDLAVGDAEEIEECSGFATEGTLRHGENDVPFGDDLVNLGVLHGDARRPNRPAAGTVPAPIGLAGGGPDA